MYLDEYKRWMAAELEDADLKPELAKIEGNDDEIKDRFAVALKFGTAGLRGVLGAGTNRMNIYVVRQATQGLANWVKTQGGSQTVAISYDSRLKSDIFAKTAAGVLAANGIKVRIYDALMPVPALSFATRYYQCNAGIMVTASHNPAKYNGYKAYGPDGCQMTDDAAAIVYDEIQKTDVLTGAKYISFAEGVEQGLIRFVGDDCKKALYDAIEARQVRPGLCKTAGLKLVYSPLNGSGLVPVTHVLNDMGITDITIVPEQEYPNGYFTTCSYPNPEIFEALKLGLELATKTGADLMLATDPDADRVGIAMKCPDGSYELVSGNEMGALLLDYICAGRIEKGTMPKKPVAVKSIVSTPLADAIAAHYGVEMRSVLTGFKWIGDQIANLEAAGEVDRFIFGFEESYGYPYELKFLLDKNKQEKKITKGHRNKTLFYHAIVLRNIKPDISVEELACTLYWIYQHKYEVSTDLSITNICKTALNVMKLDSSTESFKKAGKRKYLINPIYKALPIELKRKELGKARRKKRNEYILSNFDCNKTIEENAKELNIAASTIYAAFKENKIEKRNDTKFQNFLEAYWNNHGASIRELAKLTKLATSTIQRYLQRIHSSTTEKHSKSHNNMKMRA